jgi:hypothetical protein
MKRPTEPTEHAEQCVVLQWAALNAGKWPCLRLLYAVPNGAFFGGEVKQLQGGKSVPVAAIRARKLKAEGLKEGVPDLCLPVPSGAMQSLGGPEFYGLYIEMKRRTQGKPSAMQKWWHAALTAQGYRVALCHGAAAAIEVLRQHAQRSIPQDLPPLPEPRPKGTRARQPAAKAKQAKKPVRRPFLIPPPSYGPS